MICTMIHTGTLIAMEFRPLSDDYLSSSSHQWWFIHTNWFQTHHQTLKLSYKTPDSWDVKPRSSYIPKSDWWSGNRLRSVGNIIIFLSCWWCAYIHSCLDHTENVPIVTNTLSQETMTKVTISNVFWKRNTLEQYLRNTDWIFMELIGNI